jgi:predicted nucleic acid-binding protein
VALEWVTREDHERAAEALLVADRRNLSLVDCVSFEVGCRLDIRECLAFDRHCAEQGFSPVNPPASTAPQESRVQPGDGVSGGES